jgi:hypothetical protein
MGGCGAIQGLEEARLHLLGGVEDALEQTREVIEQQVVEVGLGTLLESSQEILEALLALIEGVAAYLNQVRHELEGHLVVKYFAAILDRLEDGTCKAEGSRGQGLTDDLLLE